MKPLPMETLRVRLSVDEAGVLRWKDGPRRGKVAGTPNGNGYLTIRLDGQKLYAHRVVLALTSGIDPFPLLVDHRYGKRDVNAPDGLRTATNVENLANRVRLNSNNTSGATGVCWSRAANKWAASVRCNYVSTHLGLFVNKADAIAARANFEKART